MSRKRLSTWDAETCCRSCEHCITKDGWKGKKCNFDPQSVSVEGVFEKCKTCKHWKIDEITNYVLETCEQNGIDSEDLDMTEQNHFVAVGSEFPYTDMEAKDKVCKVCKKCNDAILAWNFFEEVNEPIYINGVKKDIRLYEKRLVCEDCNYMLEHLV